MKNFRHLLWLSLVVSCLLQAGFAAEVAAQSLPLRYIARPLTLPKLTVRIDAEQWQHVIEPRDVDNTAGVNFGAAVGITSNAEVAVMAAPMRLAPTFYYGNPELQFRYRFISGVFELGVHGSGELPVKARGSTRAGVPMRVHGGQIVRLDFGPYLWTDFDYIAFQFPVEAAFQITNNWFLGLETGVRVNPTRRNTDGRVRGPFGPWVGYTPTDSLAARNGTFVPLGFFVGYSAGARRAGIDLMLGYTIVDVPHDLHVGLLHTSGRIFF